MPAGSIVIDLLMKTGSFITDTDRAAKKLKAFQKDAAEAARGIATGVAAVGASIAGAIVLVDQFANSIAEYQDLADKIGDTASAVASLQLAADQSGTSLDTVTSASVRLTAALSKVDEESDATAQALAAINIPLDEFRRLSPVEQLDRVAKEMAKFGTSADKTAVAVALFGKSGAELMPFLNDLAEQQERNVVLTDEQIAAADRFSKDMATLRSELGTTARVVGADLVPTFQEFLDYVRESEAAAIALSGAGTVLKTVFETLVVVGANTVFVFKSVGRDIGAVFAQFEVLASQGLAGWRRLRDEVHAEQERARADLDAFENRFLNTDLAAAGIARRLGQDPQELARRGRGQASLSFQPSDKKDKPKKETVSEAQRYLETLQNQLDRAQELTVTEQVLADIRRKSIAGLTPQLERQLLVIAGQIDAEKRWQQEKKETIERLREEIAAQEELERQGRAVFEATRTPLEKLNTELANLNNLLNKGVVDWDTYVRAVAKAQEEFAATASKGEQALNELGEFTKQAARNIQSTLGDTLFDALQGNFDNIGDRFKAVLDRMVADALAAELAEKVLGNFDKTGQVGGWAGGLADWLFGSSAPKGGTTGDFSRMDRAGGSSGAASPWWEAAASWIGTFFGGSRAGGGDVMPGAEYLVGENGPERFRPRTAGTIFPASGVGKGNGQTVHYSPTFVLQAPADRRTQQQLAADAMRGAQKAFARNG
jgi:hypothetical protein